jgi:glycogen(starch) synthase
LHILFLTPAYPPFPGGGERYTSALAHELAARGHTITVLTSQALNESDFWKGKNSPQPLAESDGEVRVVRCPIARMPGSRTGLLAWRKSMVVISTLPGDQGNILAAMARYIPPISEMKTTIDGLAGAFDLVHAFNISWEFPAIVGWHYAKRNKLPFILTPFAHFGTSSKDRVALNSTMDHQIQMLRDAHAVNVLTNVEGEGLKRLGIPGNQIVAVGSGAEPLPQFPKSAQVLNRYLVSHPYAIFIGRASRDKGAIDAMKAILRLRQAGINLNLCLVGQQSPECIRFHEQMTADQKQYFHVLGIIEDEDKHALLSAAQMLILPSRTDSFGIVFLEAWQHAKPVIGARAGGIPGVIQDGYNGLLVEFGDTAGLADAMTQLVTDLALNRRLGKNGSITVEREYSWEQVCDRVINSYHIAL